jgi:hypothetical protein
MELVPESDYNSAMMMVLRLGRMKAYLKAHLRVRQMDVSLGLMMESRMEECYCDQFGRETRKTWAMARKTISFSRTSASVRQRGLLKGLQKEAHSVLLKACLTVRQMELQKVHL